MLGANALGWPYLGQAYAGASGSTQTLSVATINGASSVSVSIVANRVIKAATINGVSSVSVSLKKTKTIAVSTIHGAASVVASIVKGAMHIAQINGRTTVSIRMQAPRSIFPATIFGKTTVTIAPFAGRWLLWNRRLRINQSFHTTLADAKEMLRRKVLHGERGKDYQILQQVPSDVDETYDPNFQSEE